MKLLVVSTYPPMSCGIGRYAEQQVAWLRREGHVVDVWSPPEGGGDWRARLCGGLRPLRLLRALWAYDRTYIHFAPVLFFNPLSAWSRLLSSLSFLIVMLIFGRRVAFIIHETGYCVDGAEVGHGVRWRVDRAFWRRAHRVIFHTVRERDSFAAFYRLDIDRDAFEIWPQDRFLAPKIQETRSQARRRLGLPDEATIFVCMGFIQPHKGFERPIEAFRRVRSSQARLYILGSVRIDWPPAHECARDLHERADDPRCEVVETYLSDELFDRWIVAADYVVAPYRKIWSSAVAARAQLYERPMLAAAAGGLAEQLGDASYLFSTDEELGKLMDRLSRDGAHSET